MEIGVYLNSNVLRIFTVLEKYDGANSRKVRKIINKLQEKYSNAPQYIDKITLTEENMTVENLTKILGEFFFGSKKDTKDSFDYFVKVFESKISKNTSTAAKPETKNFESTKPDYRSVIMTLSDDLWQTLSKIEKTNDPLCWALIKFIEHDQKDYPNSNKLGIKQVDLDKDTVTLFKVVFGDGRRQKIPIFNFLKSYFPKFNNLEINEFLGELKKVVVTADYEPGDIIKQETFEFKPKDVRRTFLSLVTETYPKGHEDEVVKFLDPSLVKDEFGNYYKIIGNSDVMFTSHLDTVSFKTDVKLISRMKEGQEFISSDGTTILGADDKAGVTILLYMIAHNIPGVYYFFVGEESGGIGSGKVAESIRRIPHLKRIKKCVSFDRRNYYSVITSQMYSDCCSDEFAQALCSELNKSGLKMGLDPTGVFTDSANFIDIIPECTNISVGYFNEHTYKEALNITYLQKLAQACLKVNWGSLPVYRQVEGSEDMYEAWEEVLNVLQDTGFYNEIRAVGDKNRLTIKLDFEQTSFTEAYTDLQNLEYVFSQMNLTPKITFDKTVIKFQIK